jgi:type VI secretion system protein ImpM
MEVGLYGKLPTHGDFLRRRAPEDFIAAWDAWLQEALAGSRAALGERWLDTYLTSPVWRFALDAGACGAASMAGVLVPSVDRVGRYFPLTLLWSTPAELSALEVAVRYQPLFERAERLMIDTLALEQPDFADFDRQVMELASEAAALPASAVRLEAASMARVLAGERAGWQLPLRSGATLALTAMQLLGYQLHTVYGPAGLWWTEGSAEVEPSWLITRGLPDPLGYGAMLDGAWVAAGWEVTGNAAERDLSDANSDAARAHIQLRSAALTDPGPVRASNQDAFLEWPERGLWAVADGLGGLRQGELASRMVCDALADSGVAGTLDEQIELAIEQLRQINGQLWRAATRPAHPVHSASTVVVLLIRQHECAILWAGDSRVYRLRDGLLSQMTTDHSETAAAQGEADDEPNPPDIQAVTRAVGGTDELQLDLVRADVRAGDRFLLCSDGLVRVLQGSALAGLLETGAPDSCCADLIQQSIARGTTDNVTAVVVDCVAERAAAPGAVGANSIPDPYGPA